MSVPLFAKLLVEPLPVVVANGFSFALMPGFALVATLRSDFVAGFITDFEYIIFMIYNCLSLLLYFVAFCGYKK